MMIYNQQLYILCDSNCVLNKNKKLIIITKSYAISFKKYSVVGRMSFLGV
jgi:hypothetical protein